MYLNNSQLALNDPTKTPITPGTHLPSIALPVIDGILDSILGTNTSIFNANSRSEQNNLKEKIKGIIKNKTLITRNNNQLTQEKQHSQKIILILQTLRQYYSGIDFTVSYDFSSSNTTTFLFTGTTCHINSFFLVLLIEKYDWNILLAVLQYLTKEYFYINFNTKIHNQSTERERLRYSAIFACQTQWETMAISCSLLATMYQQWLERVCHLGLFTPDKLPFLERKGQLYQKLAFYLDNSQLPLNDPSNIHITPGTNLPSIDITVIDAILDSIVSLNIMA